MDIKEMQKNIWAAYKNGDPIPDLAYVKEFADLCGRHPYRESYKGPLNELYKILVSHLDAKDQSDDWWEKLIKAIDEVAQKYTGTDAWDYTTEYAVIVINEVVRRSKK